MLTAFHQLKLINSYPSIYRKDTNEEALVSARGWALARIGVCIFADDI
jgi:hypothetical protein